MTLWALVLAAIVIGPYGTKAECTAAARDIGGEYKCMKMMVVAP